MPPSLASWLPLPAIATVVLACAPAEPARTGSDAELRARVALYDSTWMAKNIAAVGEILSAEYLYYSSTGNLSDRAASLDALRDTSYVLTRSDRSEVEVTLVGPIARLSSRWQGEGRYRGEAVDDDQTCGQTWMWDGGRWLLMTEHCANRPRGEG